MRSYWKERNRFPEGVRNFIDSCVRWRVQILETYYEKRYYMSMDEIVHLFMYWDMVNWWERRSEYNEDVLDDDEDDEWYNEDPEFWERYWEYSRKVMEKL